MVPLLTPDMVLGGCTEIACLIQNVPRNRDQLDKLNNRCIALLNALKELSADFENPTVFEFLHRMETILHGIKERLEPRRSFNVFAAFVKQADMQEWIELQNQNIEDAFRTLNTQFHVSHAVKLDENMARQERGLDEIRGRLTTIHMALRSHSTGEASTNPHPVVEAFKIISLSSPEPPTASSSRRRHTNQTDSRNFRQPPRLPEPLIIPGTAYFDDLSLSSSQTLISSGEPLLSICKMKNGSISSANLVGLVDRFLAREEKQFERILLDTYEDYTTPEEFFDVLQQRFQEVPREMTMDCLLKRHKILEAIPICLQSVSSDSELLNVVRRFATATENHLTQKHETAILKAIDPESRASFPRLRFELCHSFFQSRAPISPASCEKVEPSNPDDIAVALTFMEANARETVRWIDYLRYDRDLSSRIDALLSSTGKMQRWVKFSILRHGEIKARVTAIERFVKIAEACLELHNYNSAAIIAAVLLDWKSKPTTDIPRTMDALKKTTQASIKRLANFIDPHRNYEAYREFLKLDTNHIPWLVAHLDDVKRCLSRYPRTVEVDNVQLINFERYQHLALKVKVPGYRVPLDLEGERRKNHIEYLRHQIDTVKFDEETERRRLRILKKREDEDYRSRRPEMQSLGFK
ncbi:Serine/threonine-protein kinase STY17 [Mycena sanguinolenta]|uniref:Serine/threonine-protein kinase STY17 n=1 Tax=Mycena sanguinolenta TaxID=230812 RepID=A0A8H6XCJ0_9AGAR|nr:Serine/threonine-protein kinase STY17 [Mycena sanguinolenta]